MLLPPIDRYCLADSPDVTVARVALGLTLYLAEPLRWARGAASEALSAFAATIGWERMAWYCTSRVEHWYRFHDQTTLSELLANLSSAALARPRHAFRFRVVDDTGAPSFGFEYREVDDARVDCAGVLEVTLSQEQDPGELLQLALQLGNLGPFYAGVGGYAARVNEWHRSAGFWRVHAWARRYLGLDAQDADAMAWRVLEALPGSNWLTMVGAPLMEKLELDVPALTGRAWKHDVAPLELRHGVLVRAGEAPTVGDLNALRVPAAYAEVAQALGEGFVAQPPEFWGRFMVQRSTDAWFRRFLDPLTWEREASRPVEAP